MDKSITPPHIANLALESRVVFETGSGLLSLLTEKSQSIGSGKPVLVIPGFGASDMSTFILRNYLKRSGFEAHGWGLGINRGTTGKVRDSLIKKVAALHQKTNQKVAVVGWSLGGIFARELARNQTQHIDCVVTLASPFAGSPHGNRLFPIALLVSGKPFTKEDEQSFDRRTTPPPVRTLALHSRTDGIVNWKCSLEPIAAESFNDEVQCSHFGFPSNPQVLRKVAMFIAATPN
ncbi:hypothetical protein OLMES_3392 [Oleiphilus messinensis]|uniref:AB hydrolase-1 domain-containing protein n=1 Tax=Oleiphilus messinensis TaxID=141451 RepID=A0A1Y0IB01_9GAMM|nr:alpha/beta fold hydrolase [Oleiphilus messinensis]ARU57430.1 hypothetical protein OLMES_3392 [Oleiphilus messinensis]